MSILGICSIFCSVPVILVFLFGTFHKSKKEVRDIGVLAIAFLLVDIVCFILAKARINNLALFHFITLLELVIFGKLFYQNSSGYRQTYLKYATYGGVLIVVLNSIFNEGLLEFNSSARVFQGVLLISFAVIWFVEVFQTLKEETLGNDPMLYVASGVLIYFSGSTVIFGQYNQLMLTNPEYSNVLWDVHSVLNILLNLFLVIALFKMRSKPQVIE